MNASMKSRMVSSKSIKRLASIGDAVPDASGYEYAGGNTKGSFIPRFFRITGVRDPGGTDDDADSLAVPRIGSFPPPAAARTAPTGVFFAVAVAIRIVLRPSIIVPVVVAVVVVVVVARNAAIIILFVVRSLFFSVRASSSSSSRVRHKVNQSINPLGRLVSVSRFHRGVTVHFSLKSHGVSDGWDSRVFHCFF